MAAHQAPGVAPIAFFVMRDRPQDKDLRPLGLPDTETVPSPATGSPFVAAISRWERH
jgi:hypothetical protein